MSALPNPLPSPLSVYRGESLEQLFETEILPKMHQRSRTATHIADKRLAFRQWQEYWDGQRELAVAQGLPEMGEPLASEGSNVGSATRISYPCVVSDITDRHLLAWQTHLMGVASVKDPTKKLTAQTINRKVGFVHEVLKRAHKLGLLSRLPEFDRLPEPKPLKHYVSREQVTALYGACESLHWPQLGFSTIRASDWWRFALVLYWTYGFRTQELIAFQPRHQPLTWANIHFGPESPNPAGHMENACGWLEYTPQKQSWAKPLPLYLPLTRHARAILDAIAKETGKIPSGRVFPFPQNQRNFYAAWNRIQEVAKVHRKDGEPYELKAIRKSASSYLNKHKRGLSDAVLGHADREQSKVAATHYDSNEEFLVEELGKYRVPSCFDAVLEFVPKDKQMLFSFD